MTLRRLADWQPSDPGPRAEPWLRLGFAVFAVAFALTIVVDAFVHETISLGPGLVDEPEGGLARLSSRLASLSTGAAVAIAALCLGVLVWNGVMLYRGLDDELPRRELISFFLLNGVLTALLYASLALAGAVSAARGHGFAGGYDVVRHLTRFCLARVDRIPTLIHLPYPLPLIATIAAVDLFHYWFHRLGHTFRPFWLLWHRPHHMTPYLTIPTTQPVFAAFPLFLLLSVPFQIGVGISAKLFSSETMVVEALLFRAVGQIVAIGSHNSALYSRFHGNRFLRALGGLYGEGSFHYMHHSALPEHAVINLGGPFFMFWDRVFGTYVAPTASRPPAGLTGAPRLHLNPLRLALAGLLQLGYELRANAEWRVRLAILFGPSTYTPRRTKDFALDEEEEASSQRRP